LAAEARESFATTLRLDTQLTPQVDAELKAMESTR
jgi:hypothetical protein